VEEKKRKTMPFGVSLMRSKVLCPAAQYQPWNVRLRLQRTKTHFTAASVVVKQVLAEEMADACMACLVMLLGGS
jgi:hypothetical protein